MKTVFEIVNDKYTLEQERAAFAMLCGKDVEEFMRIPKRSRRAEDYGKYLCIAMLFRLKRIFIRITGDCEARSDEIISYLSSEGRKLEVVDGWIYDMMNNISDKDLRSLVFEFWSEKRKKFEGNVFETYKLF